MSAEAVRPINDSLTIQVVNGGVRIVPITSRRNGKLVIHMVRLICRDDVNGRESRMDIYLEDAQKLAEALMVLPWLEPKARIQRLST